ncbi:protein spinster homolog 1 [Aplysia californica]|uniref:Protein spinster homolog 1 n=1 Tax=Aplysia californica TaxID=6500 RepID=A0ABM1AC04_APLCA|nr:protein spinster homolog 1 [Aplysia californica]
MSRRSTGGVSRTPFDDTVQLTQVMPSDEFSDDAPLAQDDDSQGSRNPEVEPSVPVISKTKAYVTVLTLLFVNLLNYMDRFTVAGVLIEVKDYYGLNNSEAGIIQTAFICTYMLCSPVFGYLGDRYTRKYLMAVGILLWSLLTLCSSFVPADYFYGFVLLRALVGVGEASYSTIAPTIIADLFAKEMRTKALMVFYFAIPVGSGLGYIVGSNVASLLGEWQWALRVTPALGIVCVVLIVFFCQEPPRGMSEGGDVHLRNTDVLTDVKALAKNKSFMLSSVGFTCVAFVTGALAFLAPTFMTYAMQMEGNPQPESTVSLIFGGITVAAGFIGVALGAEGARRYRRVNPRADPLVCAFGILMCVPFLFFALVMSATSALGTWILIFIGETLLCLNWAVTADILLCVVIPTRRSLAESGQILMSHALGDAISPYIIGQIADSVAADYVDPIRPSIQFLSMQTALYLTTFICVLGGASYLATALCFQKDKARAEKLTHGGGDVHVADDDELLVDGADVNFVAEDESLSLPVFFPGSRPQSVSGAVAGAVQVADPSVQAVDSEGDAGIPSRNVVV